MGGTCFFALVYGVRFPGKVSSNVRFKMVSEILFHTSNIQVDILLTHVLFGVEGCSVVSIS